MQFIVALLLPASFRNASNSAAETPQSTGVTTKGEGLKKPVVQGDAQKSDSVGMVKCGSGA